MMIINTFGIIIIWFAIYFSNSIEHIKPFGVNWWIICGLIGIGVVLVQK
jgi:hypothetical protein